VKAGSAIISLRFSGSGSNNNLPPLYPAKAVPIANSPSPSKPLAKNSYPASGTFFTNSK
jgi:hypothetical protein